MTDAMPVREMTLEEQIRALKEYDVPEPFIERMLDTLVGMEERVKRRYADKDKLIGILYDTISYKDEAINALGAYIKMCNAQHREA